MRGGIIYFSGTGNTRYIAQLFHTEFLQHSILCDLIDIAQVTDFQDQYDFLVFGGPIYVEIFPKYFTDWIKTHLSKGQNRQTIIFSTQGANSACGTEQLSRLLKRRGYQVQIAVPITMPNNFYVTAFPKTPDQEVAQLKAQAATKVADLVHKFIQGETQIIPVSTARLWFGKFGYFFFDLYSKNWAKSRLTVDEARCIKCQKCIEKCPSENITMKDGQVIFLEKCLVCQGCLHLCPTNAFRQKGKHFEQYQL